MATNDQVPSTGHHPSERARPGKGRGGGDYSDEEVAFMLAMDRLKRRMRRMPTAVEVLAEAVKLGYRKQET